jgi:ATP-dependent protease Clp ATPase subunit
MGVDEEGFLLFCGKQQTQVKHGVAGPGSVDICNECIDPGAVCIVVLVSGGI